MGVITTQASERIEPRVGIKRRCARRSGYPSSNRHAFPPQSTPGKINSHTSLRTTYVLQITTARYSSRPFASAAWTLLPPHSAFDNRRPSSLRAMLSPRLSRSATLISPRSIAAARSSRFRRASILCASEPEPVACPPTYRPTHPDWLRRRPPTMGRTGGGTDGGTAAAPWVRWRRRHWRHDTRWYGRWRHCVRSRYRRRTNGIAARDGRRHRLRWRSGGAMLLQAVSAAALPEMLFPWRDWRWRWGSVFLRYRRRREGR